MRAKSSIVMAGVAILSLVSQVAFSQYGPPVSPGYPGAYGPGAMPMGVASPYMIPNAQMQMAPPAAFAVQPMTAGISDNKPAFRIQLEGDGSSVTPTIIPAAHAAQRDCKDGACDVKGGKGKGKECSPCYHFRIFGELLYLRARDAEVTYAVEANLNLPTVDLPPVQTSPIGLVDQDFSTGFRAGFGLCLDECSELAVTYTMFETNQDDYIYRDPANNNLEIYPMVIHPATENAITSTVEAAGNVGIDFDLVDLDFRRVLARSCQADLIGVVGIRYGSLEQNFGARFSDDLAQVANDTEVLTDIDFEGIGLRLGLDGEYYSCRLPIMMYAKGATSLLAGEFDAAYQQTVQNNSYPGVDTAWTAGRIVPTFDLEIGTGYYSPCGTLRATIGYAYSVWTNVVKTEDWIHGVQTNDFRDMGDSFTFDGVVLRLEGRF